MEAKSETGKFLDLANNGISIILVVNGKHATILTFLADSSYKAKPQELPGREAFYFPKQVG